MITLLVFPWPIPDSAPGPLELNPIEDEDWEEFSSSGKVWGFNSAEGLWKFWIIGRLRPG